MSHALITIVAPLEPERVPTAEAAIDTLGNPAQEHIRARLDQLDEDGAGTHFASLHAIRSVDGARAYILFECSADGPEDRALARIVAGVGEFLRSIFMLASDWSRTGDLATYLREHQINVGAGWFDNPGLCFAGTPGMSVGRIRDEARLANHISGVLAEQPANLQALERVELVRKRLKEDGFANTLMTGAPEPSYVLPSRLYYFTQLALAAITTYLWPAGFLALAWTIYSAFRVASSESALWPWVGAFVAGAWGGLWAAFWITFLAALVFAAAAYALLRRAESGDWLDERVADRATNAAMFARENMLAQNHMISVTQRKPQLVRRFTQRLAFCFVAVGATKYFQPGFLSGIGTIHFARWVTPLGSPDLIFLSNYDSSWESYLEDFITRAHNGLTAVWSNSIGFPRAQNLLQNGATDGERFKRYARHSMIPTRFWYSAYPTLTTTNIRSNAELRRGLSGTMTEDEAMNWLSLFGSAARPVSKLVSNEIQSLIFGGLGFMPYGTCLLIDLPKNDVPQARRWAQTIKPHIAFNDGRRLGADAVVTFALGAGGLARLGLPADSLETFPFAFLEGMTNGARARILGDLGPNSIEHWHWGRTQPDAALLVYGRSEDAVANLERALIESIRSFGMSEPYKIPLRKVGRTEPFGFADGISQPVIRGSYKALRNGDPIHIVEPGEFILGYPDNRANLPPGPTMQAIQDPANHLPLVAPAQDFGRAAVESVRDVGFNGSFLVIRQLEQDVSAFHNYCAQEADRLAQGQRLPPPYVITQEFIAAKLVGRWADGASLVRHPYEPPEREKRRYDPQAAAPRKMSMRSSKASALTTPEATRPKTHPAGGPPIDPAADQTADNVFLFGTEDPEALRCPYGAHVRRSNPRDSFDPGSADQIDITNRHRIVRVGRQYEPKPGENPGLLFMCLNGDIERQFEFLQQTWLKSPSFHGLSCEKDALLGDAEVGVCSYTIPTREGPVRLSPMPRFITTKGGGYFFLPGKRLIDYLSTTN
jgi:deferrochelatase/peroxidase EfeB